VPAHLHLHTNFSLLDALPTPAEVLAAAAEAGFEFVAVTDHGYLAAWPSFLAEARSRGLKPILGLEAYLDPDWSEDSGKSQPQSREPYHVTLLALDDEGLKNLLLISNQAHLHRFHYKPQVHRSWLVKAGRGIAVTSGCVKGEVLSLIRHGDLEGAERVLRWWADALGENFYVEFQDRASEEFRRAYDILYELTSRLGLKMLFTNDVHFLRPQDYLAHSALVALGRGSTLAAVGEYAYGEDGYYLLSPDALVERAGRFPGSLAGLEDLLSRYRGYSGLPTAGVPLPPGLRADEAFEYLRTKVFEALSSARDLIRAHGRWLLEERLEYELKVISDLGFVPYMLVIADVVGLCRSLGIPVSVRGSGAASLILRLLGVTHIDPIAMGLYFERFLNPGRREPPDVDIDVASDRRQELICALRNRYGLGQVAQIGTYVTMAARAAFRDAARVLGYAAAHVDALLKPIPLGASLDELLAAAEQAGFNDPMLPVLARSFEGRIKAYGVHAAGIVLADKHLTQVLPLMWPVGTEKDKRFLDATVPVSQWDMDALTSLGFLKLDFLGSDTMRAVAETFQRTGLDWPAIRLDDQRAWRLLKAGRTGCVFQLEGAGMTRTLKEVSPRDLKELTAVVALYRPGPKEHIPEYVRGKLSGRVVPEGFEDIPELAGVTAETYGTLVYQEQVIGLFKLLAGYDASEADIVRKAIGKKIPEVMAAQRAEFIERGVQRGYPAHRLDALWALIEPFAGYAFNKAHAASYAYLAYVTAYLKARYPAYYLTAFLNAKLGDLDEQRVIIKDMLESGVAVLAPDVNLSQAYCVALSPVGPVRLGLKAVKGLGRSAEAVVTERERNGPYRTLAEFIKRTHRQLDIEGIKALIIAGALDAFGSRPALLRHVEYYRRLLLKPYKRHPRGRPTLGELEAMLREAAPGECPPPEAVLGFNPEPGYAIVRIPGTALAFRFNLRFPRT
jgi:DNA polymerase-3 subunit alpha